MRECCASRMEFFSQTATSESLALSHWQYLNAIAEILTGKFIKGI